MEKDFRRRKLEKIIEKSFTFFKGSFYKEINKSFIINDPSKIFIQYDF
jgi:hypothetical protein